MKTILRIDCAIMFAALLFTVGCGGDPNALDDKGMAKLHHAAESGDVKLLEKLLADGAKVNLVDKHGRTPLTAAILKCRDTAPAIFLIKKGTDIATGSFPAIDAAVQNDRLDILKEMGIARVVSYKNYMDEHILHMAAKHGAVNTIRWLVDGGAPVNQKNTYGETALDILEKATMPTAKEKEEIRRILTPGMTK